MTSKKKSIKTKPSAGTSITGCSFQNSIQWDAKAVDAIQTVALTLLENARAANALVSVFASQNIQIDPMLVIQSARDE